MVLIMSGAKIITANGTAVCGSKRYWRSHPAESPGCEQGTSPGGKPVWRNFCESWERGDRARCVSRYTAVR
jgi:hypothetical protein